MPTKLRLTPSKHHAVTKRRKADAFHVREHESQRTVVEWAQWNESRWPELKLLHAIPNGVPLHGPQKFGIINWLKAQGLKNGVPDLFLPCPRFLISDVIHGLYIEMKAGDGGVLSPDQARWHEHLHEQGYRVVVCRSSDEAIKELTQYLEMEKE